MNQCSPSWCTCTSIMVCSLSCGVCGTVHRLARSLGDADVSLHDLTRPILSTGVHQVVSGWTAAWTGEAWLSVCYRRSSRSLLSLLALHLDRPTLAWHCTTFLHCIFNHEPLLFIPATGRVDIWASVDIPLHRCRICLCQIHLSAGTIP